MTANLKVVNEGYSPSDCVEGIIRACVSRRAALRRDLHAEDRRLDYLRRRLADERGLAFIRPEMIEREFGS